MPEILYQDAQLAVCIKPAGAASEGNAPQAMPALLRAQLGCEVYPVHRLDQPVGGVMVYAKTPKAAAALTSCIQSGAFYKEYLAVLPQLPQEAEATLHNLLYYDRRLGKSYAVTRKRAGVKDASLFYRVEQKSDGLCLVRIHLHTGRTHQIRVQFASRQLPLLGDGKYGSHVNCPLALWSAQLRFANPTDGASLCFAALPPDAFPWNRFNHAAGFVQPLEG